MKLSWQRRLVHLKHSFNTAHNIGMPNKSKEMLLCTIEHGDHIAWGEASPVSYYDQSTDSAEAMFADAAGMLGDDPFAFETVLERLWELFPDQPAAIAAIDNAMYDLVGKITGLPVWKLLGLDPRRVPVTSFTIGIDDLDKLALKVREAEEYPILKIKVGTEEDEAILTMIRREAPDKTIRVDANCAWNATNVEAKCRQLEAHGIEFIEQPIAHDDSDGLEVLYGGDIESPLIADESCHTAEDVLGCRGAFDGVNIKLSKCGGIRRGLEMIHVARAAGMKVMLGCMVSTSVGIAGALQLAPLVDFIDLDGHLLLADDPFEGIGGREGRLALADRPGLGVTELRT